MTKQKVKNGFIKRDTLIGDMVSNYPKTVDIMLSWGLACVGCSINVFESVEEGARVHGQMTDEEIDKLLIELNSVAKPIKKLKVYKDFYITERALLKIKSSAKAEKKQNYGLRVKVIEEEGDREYELEFKKHALKQERVVIIKSLSLFIDPISQDLLEGYYIDYIKTPLQEGFKFEVL